MPSNAFKNNERFSVSIFPNIKIQSNKIIIYPNLLNNTLKIDIDKTVDYQNMIFRNYYETIERASVKNSCQDFIRVCHSPCLKDKDQ